MTPAERAVVEAAIRWSTSAQAMRAEGFHPELSEAVDVLLAERAGSQLTTVQITWEQVVEGDRVYRDADGGPAPVGARGGRWCEVIASGPIGAGRLRVHVRGLSRPIEPAAGKTVTVQRGATGSAVDALGSVIWSGPSSRATGSEQ